MSTTDTHTNPAIIRAALEHAERTSLSQAARTLGVSRKAVTLWRNKRAANGPQWPTDEDIATWHQRKDQLAEKRARYRMQAARYRARRRRNRGHLHIDPTGTERRIQGLFALGYTSRQLAVDLGVTPSRVSQIGNRYWDKVHVTTAIRVMKLYNRLSMVRPEGWVADRQRRHAREVGWCPPLSWDDDTIDDPSSRPAGVLAAVDREPGGYDESRIERRVAGDRDVKLHKGETAEVVRRLLAAGMTTTQIRNDFGIKTERYVKVSDLRQGVAA